MFQRDPRQIFKCCKCLDLMCASLVLLLGSGMSAPVNVGQGQSKDISTSSETLNYLVQYGYIEEDDPHTGSLRSEDSFISALKHFQQMAGIPITGQIDNDTVRMLNTPRCGNKDNTRLGPGARKKRYALQGSKWAKRDLTFKISEYPRGIPRDRAEKEVHSALKVWGDVTPLNFILRPYDDRVDIDVRFTRRNHGDGNPFDGRGKTLAHAFFPQYGGDAHFDDDENWTINLSSGINMFQVAAHEFGHSLGLSHSDVSTALMAPFYRGYQRHFRLDQDDVSAIQELYGSQRRSIPPPRGDERIPSRTPRPPKPTRGPVLSVPKICTDSRVDAVTMGADGYTYIFKGEYYYKLNNYGIAQGYPRAISEDWAGLTGPIDSALHWDNGYTYIFKGAYYWKFFNRSLKYTRSISDGFKGIPNNIDAAFVWGGNGKTYFVKGGEYWRYTVNRVDTGYPKPMSVWVGLPRTIDSALKWKNGRTYFFSQHLYYRYNDVDFNIDTTYPRTISNWWFGCPDPEQVRHLMGGLAGLSDARHNHTVTNTTTNNNSNNNNNNRKDLSGGTSGEQEDSRGPAWAKDSSETSASSNSAAGFFTGLFSRGSEADAKSGQFLPVDTAGPSSRADGRHSNSNLDHQMTADDSVFNPSRPEDELSIQRAQQSNQGAVVFEDHSNSASSPNTVVDFRKGVLSLRFVFLVILSQVTIYHFTGSHNS